MDLSFERDILGWVRNRAPVDALMGTALRVINTGGLYTYVPPTPGERTFSLKGLTRLMADILYTRDADGDTNDNASGWTRRADAGGRKKKVRARADGDPEAVKRRRHIRALTQPELDPGPARGIARRHTMDGLRGAVRGSYIHQQIEAAVMLDRAAFQRKYREGMNPWAHNLMGDILKRGMRPFRAEFVVYDLTIGCATQIDLVAVDPAGTLVFIENKTGYGGGAWTRAEPDVYWTTPALARLPNFPCTPRNKAIVQITLGAIMAAKMLSLPMNAYRLAVMRIDEHVIEYTPVNADFLLTEGIALYEHLRAARTRRAR